MKTKDFKERNVTLVKEGCFDLPCYRGNGQVVSCWKPSFIERLRILFGCNIWLHVMGNTQPPVYLEITKEFSKD